VMTIEYIALKKEITVNQAFEKIRREGVDKETIYTCYVTDEKRALLGSVSVKDMLLADPESKMEDIMETNDIRAHTTDDREELANDFRRYGLLAIPVVDHEERLVGIVTVDDMVQVIEEENTEDFEKMAAITPSDSPYLDTNVMTLAKKRLPWLMLLMISATFTGTILSSFENAFAVIPALVTAIPMIMDTGGNSGSQSSTLVTRGLALEEIKPKDGFKVWLKELRVGLICGVCLAIVNMLRMLIMNCITDMSTAFAMSNILLCLTVSLALMCAVIVAKSVGCLLPLLAKMLGGDPAVMASPIITTIVDAISLIVYFALATIILGL